MKIIIIIGLIIFLLCSSLASAEIPNTISEKEYTISIGSEKLPILAVHESNGNYNQFMYLGNQYQTIGFGNEFQCIL